jgi:hypothetical protein
VQIGFVGLGKMGGNMVKRLLTLGGHSVVVTDRSADAVNASVEAGATSASDLADLVSKLSGPRAVWVMVPSGAPTDIVINELGKHLSAGTSSSTAATATSRVPGSRQGIAEKGICCRLGHLAASGARSSVLPYGGRRKPQSTTSRPCSTRWPRKMAGSTVARGRRALREWSTTESSMP